MQLTHCVIPLNINFLSISVSTWGHSYQDLIFKIFLYPNKTLSADGNTGTNCHILSPSHEKFEFHRATYRNVKTHKNEKYIIISCEPQDVFLGKYLKTKIKGFINACNNLFCSNYNFSKQKLSKSCQYWYYYI